jgi:hypothetical protein
MSGSDHDALIHAALTEVQRDLREHMDREETALMRIERLLDGNGQPGLVRGHTSHEERLKALEGWKVWMVGTMVSMSLAALALMGQLLLPLIKGHP